MNLQLPDAVATYFATCNDGNVSRIPGCFCTDATVRDENRTHEGVEAIQSWQRCVRQAFTYCIEPVSAVSKNGQLTVRTRVTGNFPGSPVMLNHLFTLNNSRIRSLEIAP
jgi:hypothetical protein